MGGLGAGIARGIAGYQQQKKEQQVASNRAIQQKLLAGFESAMENATPEALPMLHQQYQQLAMLDPYDVKSFQKKAEKLGQVPATFLGTQRISPPVPPTPTETLPAGNAPVSFMGMDVNIPYPEKTIPGAPYQPPQMQKVPGFERSTMRTPEEESLQKLWADAQAFPQKLEQFKAEKTFETEMQKSLMDTQEGDEVPMTEADLLQATGQEFPPGSYKAIYSKSGKFLRAVPTREPTSTARKYAWQRDANSPTGWRMDALDINGDLQYSRYDDPPTSIAGSTSYGTQWIQSGASIVEVPTTRTTLPNTAANLATPPPAVQGGRVLPRKITAEENKDMAKMGNFLSIGDETLRLMAKNPQALGPVVSYLNNLGMKYAPVGSFLESMGGDAPTDPEIVQLYQNMDWMNNSLVYLLSGKQINVEEFKRLKKQMSGYNLRPETAIPRMQKAIQYLADIHNRQMTGNWKWEGYTQETKDILKEAGIPLSEDVNLTPATPPTVKKGVQTADDLLKKYNATQ